MPSRTFASIPALAAVALLAGCASERAPMAKGPPDPIADEAAFFRKNADARNVVTLPGLQYMVMQSGPAAGPHPRRTDDVTVRYEGRFLNGQVFGASPRGGLDTETFQLNKLIPGWVAALQMMRPGDIWMIYVPSNLAYGETGKSPIGPFSTLVFRVELVSVAPHVEAPPPLPPPLPPPPPPPAPAPIVATPEPPPPPPPPPPAKARPVHHHTKPKPAAEPAADGAKPAAAAPDTTPGKMFKGSES